jgi:hypothetical protein
LASGAGGDDRASVAAGGIRLAEAAAAWRSIIACSEERGYTLKSERPRDLGRLQIG